MYADVVQELVRDENITEILRYIDDKRLLIR